MGEKSRLPLDTLGWISVILSARELQNSETEMKISIASFIKVKWKNETKTGLMKLLALLNRKKFQFFRLSKKKKRKKWKQGNDRAA